MVREQIEARGRVAEYRERLSEAGMVDIFGMFRRRPAKRSPAGFARSREDITALGDSFGDMLTSPVRDAPPMARAASAPGLELTQPPVEPPRAEKPRSQAKRRPSKHQGQYQDQQRQRPASDQAARLSGCA